jgi:hypothetical protein
MLRQCIATRRAAPFALKHRCTARNARDAQRLSMVFDRMQCLHWADWQEGILPSRHLWFLKASNPLFHIFITRKCNLPFLPYSCYLYSSFAKRTSNFLFYSQIGLSFFAMGCSSCAKTTRPKAERLRPHSGSSFAYRSNAETVQRIGACPWKSPVRRPRM